jgi:hypothetical protein
LRVTLRLGLCTTTCSSPRHSDGVMREIESVQQQHNRLQILHYPRCACLWSTLLLKKPGIILSDFPCCENAMTTLIAALRPPLAS